MVEKKAIIYDLDNTIYPVASIAPKLFPPLYKLLENHGYKADELAKIKQQILGIPFQKVAASHGFSKELLDEAVNLLKNMEYKGDIQSFSDYPKILELAPERYLVTTGFPTLQWSKIRGMGIEKDFAEIYIVDPSSSQKTKKVVFSEIMQKHGYQTAEMLVIGDDPESEIKAAVELGIDTILYDKDGRYPEGTTKYKISSYNELEKILKEDKS